MDGVSFVCTVFNKAALLPGVLAALAVQVPERPREFIFIDDGSSDGSAEIVERIAGDWPGTTIVRQANGGPSAATNAGLARASQTYVKLLGSDDVLAPFATEILIRALEATRAGAVISRQGYYRTPDEISFDEAAARASVARLLGDPLADAILRTVSGTSQTLYRREAVRAAGGCDGRVFVEDFSLALRVARVAPVAELDALTCYGPAADPSRIMIGRGHQVAHDVNLTLANFLRDHPDLPARYRRLALRRAASRAWNFARREGGASWLSPHALRYLIARLGPPVDQAAWIERTLAAFDPLGPRNGKPIVRPRGAAVAFPP